VVSTQSTTRYRNMIFFFFFFFKQKFIYSYETIFYAVFLRNEQPSVKRARPPVGWQRTVAHEAQTTTVWAWLKTVVI
jgi:hypothetical protein